MAAQAAALHSPADLRIVRADRAATASATGRGCAGCRTAGPQGEDAYALIGTDADSVARRDRRAGPAGRRRGSGGPRTCARGGAAGEPGRPGGARPGAAGCGRCPAWSRCCATGPSVGVYAICLDREERLLPEECQRGRRATDAGPGVARCARRGAAPPIDRCPRRLVRARLVRAAGPGARPAARRRGDSDESALPGSVRLLDLLGLEPPTGRGHRGGWALDGRSTRGGPRRRARRPVRGRPGARRARTR